MARGLIQLEDLVIPAGETDSNKVGPCGIYTVMEIFAPESLAETVTVKVAPSKGGRMRKQASAGATIVVGEDTSVTLTNISFDEFQLVASVAVAAERRFELTGQRSA